MKSRRPTWHATAICTILLIPLISPAWAKGQSQPPQGPEIQQLKDKLQQLEQAVQELKGEINAAEQAQRPPVAAPATPPSAAVTTTAPTEGTPSMPPAKPTVGEGAHTNLDIYGFAMLDSGYDFGQTDPLWFDVVRPTKLPSFANEFGANGNTYFSVRQTRFGVKSSTPTSWGDLKTQFEFELFGTGVDAGQTTFRLRHAYGELGPVLAGQTWSVFMDIDVFPNSVEYWGPPGMVFFRNVQIRWTPIRNDRTELALALERPGASADQGVYSDRIELTGIKPRFNLPDFTWHIRETRGWGYVQLAGIFRKIGWVDTLNDAFNLSGTAFGWGVNATSNVKFGKKNTGRFEAIYGEGIENYMNDAPVDIGIKNNFGNPITPIKGVPLPVFGLVSFLDHNWSDRFSTAIGYSLIDIENSDAQNPSDFHQGHYALTNLLFHPVPDVTIGSEFQYGRRVNFSDGFNVNDYRIQFSFKYNWKKSLTF